MVSTILAALSTVFFLSPFWIDVFTGSVYSRAPMFATSFPERKKETWELVFHLRFLLVAPSPSKIIWKKEKLNTRKQKKKTFWLSPFKITGHFRVPKNLTFKARLSAKPLIWKWFLIMMQIKLIFTTKVSHLALFWEWEFLELGNSLLELRKWPPYGCLNSISYPKAKLGGWRKYTENEFDLILVTVMC